MKIHKDNIMESLKKEKEEKKSSLDHLGLSRMTWIYRYVKKRENAAFFLLPIVCNIYPEDTTKAINSANRGGGRAKVGRVSHMTLYPREI